MRSFLIAVIFWFSSNLWAASISVEAPYVRLLPPTQSITSAFMVFKNATNSDRALVSAESDVSELVELHAHLHENGLMKMRQVDKIVIPAGGELVLEPGGYHMMLIGLTHVLELGQVIKIDLYFDDGSRTQTLAEVKNIMSGMNMQSGDMHNEKAED